MHAGLVALVAAIRRALVGVVAVRSLCGYLSGAYWTTTLPELIDATAAHIRAAVEQDANDLNPDLTSFDAEVALLHDFVIQRAAFVSAFLGCPN